MIRGRAAPRPRPPRLGHPMTTDLRGAIERYVRAKPLSRGTRNEY